MQPSPSCCLQSNNTWVSTVHHTHACDLKKIGCVVLLTVQQLIWSAKPWSFLWGRSRCRRPWARSSEASRPSSHLPSGIACPQGREQSERSLQNSPAESEGKDCMCKTEMIRVCKTIHYGETRLFEYSKSNMRELTNTQNIQRKQFARVTVVILAAFI